MQPFTHQQKISRGRIAVYEMFKFFASVVASWTVTATTTIPTATTNGPALRYNPSFIDTLSIAESRDLVLHEAGHIIFGHHVRMGKRDPELWNISTDLSLNDRLGQYMDPNGAIRQHGLFPGEGQYAHLPRGKSAEWYYDALKAEQQAAQPEPGTGAPSDEQEPQDGDQEESETTQPEQGSGEQESEAGGDGSQDAQDEAGDSGAGSGTTPSGEQAEGQATGREPWSFGEVEPTPTQDPQEAEAEWQRQVARAINTARQAGDLPGWAAELAEELLGAKSEQNYRALMRRWMTQTVPVRRTFDRPARRSAHRTDLIFPAVGSKEAAPGCVLVDTSGSMDLAAMNTGLTEMEGVLSTFAYCEVTLRMADTRLLDSSRIYRRWDFPLRVPVEWQGRGGTDLSGAIAEIAATCKYKWIAVVSDMWWMASSCPDPGVPVLWITTQDITKMPAYCTPTFGQVIGPVAA